MSNIHDEFDEKLREVGAHIAHTTTLFTQLLDLHADLAKWRASNPMLDHIADDVTPPVESR